MPAANNSAATATKSAPKPNEIRLTRFLSAPVKTVWAAWTTPSQAAHWWGPRGFTITTHSHDLRPGGHWSYTMHGPDGTDWPNTTKYLEVEPLRKLVYDHGGNADRPPLFRVTVLFTDLGNTTQMDMTMSLPTPEAAANTKKFIKKAGGDATWDRFAEYLNQEVAGKNTFVITRSFAAPRELVFDAFTQPAQLAKWMGPAGTTLEILQGRIAPGQTVFYKMTGDAGPIHFGHLHYRDIRRPDLLVYIQHFSDENGNAIRPSFFPVWPLTWLTTITFFDEPAGTTRVSILWEPQNATPEEIQAFLTARPGMTQGWTGSLDKLEDILS